MTAIVIAVIAGGFGVWRWHARNSHKIVFRTTVVKRGEVTATISATGTIEPVEVVDVGAQVAGLIQSFGKDRSGKTIDYGSMIEEGTILAKIDESVYAADLALANAQVEQAKAGELRAAADLEQTKARLAQTEAEWKRAEELGRSGLLSLSIHDSNKADYQIAKANLALGEAAIAQAKAATVQARALLAKAKRNLDFCTIKSPVSGVIIDRRVNIGQTVVASFNTPSLFLIAKDLTKMQIWVGVNEADVGRVIPGTPVTFTCDAFPKRKFNGTVGKVRLNATMTQNVVMYTVEVNAENPENILLPYLTASVRFMVQQESNALLVPNAALRWFPSALQEVALESRSSKLLDLDQINSAESNSNSKSTKQEKDAKERPSVVWVKDGEFVRPVEVKAGTSDGSNTAVSANDLRENAEVVTGEVVESSGTSTQNPFVPQIRRR